MSKWLIWDWNGTLLDDTSAALNAFNAQLVKRGLRPITRDFYRDHFAFPVKPFYERCGIDLAREDWNRLAAEYHEAYAREAKALNGEAVAVLTRAHAAGWRQCILSALREDLLEEALAHSGVRGYFEHVYGVDNLDGASKMDRARELVRVVREAGGDEMVLIGDSLHDAEVAAELGLRCVLVATGGHSAARLRTAGPTALSLSGALELI